MAEDKSGLYITLIVGIVAVLALVLLYMGGGSVASDGVTGMAVKNFQATRGVGASASGYGLVGRVDSSPEGFETSVVNAQAWAHEPCQARYVSTAQGRVYPVSSANWRYVTYCAGGGCFLNGEQIPEGTQCEDGALQQRSTNPTVAYY